MPVTLVVENLTKHFPGVVAVDQVSFRAQGGEILSLFGPNGAGKSTLVAMLAGALIPSGGRILLDGEEIRFKSPAEAVIRGIRAVYQELSVIDDLRVWEHFCLPGFEDSRRLGFVRHRQAREVATRALEKIGARIDPDAWVRDLRVSDRQLVEVARAMARQARVLLVDEPSAMLDTEDRRSVLKGITAAAEAGACVVFITHNLEDALSVGTRLLVLEDGRLIRDGATGGFDPKSFFGIEDISPELSEGKTVMESAPVLRLEGVVTRSLKRINLEVARGEVLGVAGLTGSGTEDLLRVAAGLLPARAGSVVVEGRELRPRPEVFTHAGVFYVSRDRTREWIFPTLAVQANLNAATYHRRVRWGFMDTAAEYRQAEDLVRHLNIVAPSLDAPVLTLSGGNRQKVVIGRTLAIAPSALLLDEPFTGVDARSRRTIISLLRTISAQGTAVVVSSREVDELVACSDRIVCLFRGEAVAEFSARDTTSRQVSSAISGSATTWLGRNNAS